MVSEFNFRPKKDWLGNIARYSDVYHIHGILAQRGRTLHNVQARWEISVIYTLSIEQWPAILVRLLRWPNLWGDSLPVARWPVAFENLLVCATAAFLR